MASTWRTLESFTLFQMSTNCNSRVRLFWAKSFLFYLVFKILNKVMIWIYALLTFVWVLLQINDGWVAYQIFFDIIGHFKNVIRWSCRRNRKPNIFWKQICQFYNIFNWNHVFSCLSIKVLRSSYNKLSINFLFKIIYTIAIMQLCL